MLGIVFRRSVRGPIVTRPLARPKSTAMKASAEAGSGDAAAVNTMTETEDDTVQLTPNGTLPVTTKLDLVDTKALPSWPVYRILGKNGNLIDGAVAPSHLGKEDVVKMYKLMVTIQAMDDILYNAQRQGRISFYMQNSGEEGTHIGSASALSPDDVVLAQYREVGVLLWRGFTLQQAADQCFSNEMDLGKGRQMPVHYGSAELNFQTISSPLATQLPQAAGVAYALKRAKKDACAICYFGEGAASEGDFHAAINFASTLDAPVIFFCRNNGYAISTPVKDQYRGDGIISRAAGYGVHAIRVDGNDIFAVHQATKEAREFALANNRPVMIEAMSYRRGHHSTSDDSTRYRSLAEIKHWNDHLDPVKRLHNYMLDQGWWSAEEEQNHRDAQRVDVITALTTAEKRAKPHWSELFEDVYEELPQHLKKQKEELEAHMDKYRSHYHGEK